MKNETREKVEGNLKNYLEDMDIQLKEDKAIQFKKEFNSLLEEIEPLKNTAEGEAEFKKSVQYYYFRMIKLMYKEAMGKQSQINIVHDEEYGMVSTLDTSRDIYNYNKDLLTKLNYLVASSIKTVNDAVEHEDKLAIDYTYLKTAGMDPKDLAADIKDMVSGETLPNNYLKNRDEKKTMYEDGMDIMKSAKELNVGCEVAFGELQKKAATIYTLMREEHRSHNFLWRWFKGSESRDRLNAFKTEYCRVFQISKRNATASMLRIANGKSLLQMNHNDFVDMLEDNNFYTELKDMPKEDYLDALEHYNENTKDVVDDVTTIEEEFDLEESFEREPFQINEGSIKQETELDMDAEDTLLNELN